MTCFKGFNGEIIQANSVEELRQELKLPDHHEVVLISEGMNMNDDIQYFFIRIGYPADLIKFLFCDFYKPFVQPNKLWYYSHDHESIVSVERTFNGDFDEDEMAIFICPIVGALYNKSSRKDSMYMFRKFCESRSKRLSITSLCDMNDTNDTNDISRYDIRNIPHLLENLDINVECLLIDYMEFLFIFSSTASVSNMKILFEIVFKTFQTKFTDLYLHKLRRWVWTRKRLLTVDTCLFLLDTLNI